METETPTPTATATDTPTPTATFTPTPNVYIEVTLEPSGDYARIAREISVGDYAIILLLFALLISIWLMFIAMRLKGGK